MYVDVVGTHLVSKATFFNSVWDVTDALLKAPDLQMRMPLWDAARRRRAAAGLQARGNSPLSNVIRVMGGSVILQKRPSPTGVTWIKD